MKWYGKIGYSDTREVLTSEGIGTGVWKENITERYYYGDVTKHYSNRQSSGVNDNINISNSISIVADPYANQNFRNMLYIEFEGARWKISSVEVQYPRLFLTIGGVYNGKET